MPRVIHFEIGADDPERVVQFYRMVFGWEVNKWGGSEDYWLVTTGPDSEPGIDGAIMRRASPVTATVNTIGVDSVDEFQALIVKHGGRVLTPKQEIPGVGYFSYCQDTEGNAFGIMQNIQPQQET
jgi:uncharacterized protein